MLEVVQNGRRGGDGGRRSRRDRDYAYDDDFADAPRARRRDDGRRSVAGRVGLTAILALLVMACGALAYLWFNPSALENIRGRSSLAAAVPAETVNPVAPEAQAVPPPRPSQPVLQRPPVPDVYGLVILIRNAVLSLAQANASGNYGILRDLGAPGFQRATTAASLAANFADLRGQHLDLDAISVVNPALAAQPVVDDRGLMRLVGFFPADDQKIDFDIVLQMVDGRWRLFGIGVAPEKAAEGEKASAGAKDKKAADKEKPAASKLAADKLPDNATLVKLIRGSVVALNQANAAGDYSVLRDISADGFQKANDTAKLAGVFASLRARNLDLSPVAVIDPRLFRPATIDESGYLRLTGYFPSRPEQVNFDLAFQFTDGAWKLFGIGVNTSRDAPAAEAGAAQPQAQAGTGNGPPTPNAAKEGAAVPPTPVLRPAGP